MMDAACGYENRLKRVVDGLVGDASSGLMCHFCRGGESLPLPASIKAIIGLCRSVLFPGFFGDEELNPYNLGYAVGLKCGELHSRLAGQIAAGLALEAGCRDSFPEIERKADEMAMTFMERLPEMRRVLHTDVCATFRGDPAAVSMEEVIFCYPGIKAITNYRIAHSLLELGVPVIPRMISEMAHSETGIDIHPGAVIGERFSIDHGTGVVIGATSIVGDNVKLYQGVTLGAKSFDYDENNDPVKGTPRHPIIGNNVVIYSNTSVLGRIRIGDNAVIGGNIWVTEDVADNEKLVQAKADNILRFKQDRE